MKQKHSGFGIASFSIIILTLILLIVYLLGPAYLYRFELYERIDFSFWYAFLSLPLLACILGIVGLITKDRRKIFAYLGVALSIIAMIGFYGFWMLLSLM